MKISKGVNIVNKCFCLIKKCATGTIVLKYQNNSIKIYFYKLNASNKLKTFKLFNLKLNETLSL